MKKLLIAILFAPTLCFSQSVPDFNELSGILNLNNISEYELYLNEMNYSISDVEGRTYYYKHNSNIDYQITLSLSDKKMVRVIMFRLVQDGSKEEYEKYKTKLTDQGFELFDIGEVSNRGIIDGYSYQYINSEHVVFLHFYPKQLHKNLDFENWSREDFNIIVLTKDQYDSYKTP